jgi:hypothetical protein
LTWRKFRWIRWWRWFRWEWRRWCRLQEVRKECEGDGRSTQWNFSCSSLTDHTWSLFKNTMLYIHMIWPLISPPFECLFARRQRPSNIYAKNRTKISNLKYSSPSSPSGAIFSSTLPRGVLAKPLRVVGGCLLVPCSAAIDAINTHLWLCKFTVCWRLHNNNH